MSTNSSAGMIGFVDRLADLGDGRQAAGRGLIVQDADRLDLLGLVLAQARFDGRGIGAGAPVGGDELGLEADAFRHLLPQRGELAGLHHQHLVAGRQRVDQRGFPGAGAGGGVDDHRIGGLEDGLDAFQAFLGELGEFRPAVIDDRRVHRAQHAVGDRGRSRDMQKMPSDRTRGILSHWKTLLNRGFCWIFVV